MAKADTAQLDAGHPYPELHDVVGVTICDFELWPEGAGTPVPMLSRWRMQEQHGGARGLGQVQFVFLELPKYAAARPPVTAVEKWAYFFREAPNLHVVPEELAERPFRDALEAARAAGFSEEEWEAYLRANMAIQDERGALSLAEKQGHQRGKVEGVRTSLRKILQRREWRLTAQQEALLKNCEDLATLERWLDQTLTAASPDEAFRDNPYGPPET